MRVLSICIVCVLSFAGHAWAEEDDPVGTTLLLTPAEENSDADREPKSIVVAEPEAALPAPLSATSEPEEPEYLPGFLDCRRFTVDRVHCERLNQARADIADVVLKSFDFHGARHQEFALQVFDPVKEHWHTIVLGMPVAVQDLRFQPLIRLAPDTSCQVKRLRGLSLSRMVVDLRCHGREFLVYAGKHLHVTRREEDREPGGSLPLRFEPALYLAPPAHLARSEELAREGYRIKQEIIRLALRELVHLKVPSHAYPGRLVGEVMRERVVANLGLAEQFDLCFTPARLRGCERFVPVPPYHTREEVLRAINVEAALNSHCPFCYAVSSANARGWLQFTDRSTIRKGVVRPGTYSSMVILSPQAKIDPDFERGTKDNKNLVKAAVVLIDYELSHPWVPAWVRLAFLRDPEAGLLFPGASYNGSPNQGKLITGIVERFARAKRIALETVALDRFPWEELFRLHDGPANGMSDETWKYVQKIVENFRFLRQR